MHKGIKAKIIKTVCFTLLSIALVLSLCAFMKPKNQMDYADNRSYEAYRVFDEPKNSIDVIMLGHSGVYRGLSPMEMYGEYGFTSYACSMSVQLPWESYDILYSVLQTQSPRVVLLETDHLFYDNSNSIDESYGKYTFQNIFPIFKNHACWKDWLPGKSYRERSATKGYQYTDKVRPYTGGGTLVPTKKSYKMHEKHYEALEKIYKLCKEKNIKLFLIEVPSVMIWDTEKYNCINAYAKKRGLDFIDTNQCLEEFGFNWTTDTCDRGDHLNYSGAKKLSAYMGKYLKERYDLPDRRSDENYSFWKEDFLRYKKIVGE